MNGEALLEQLEPLMDPHCGLVRPPLRMGFPLSYGAYLHAYTAPTGRIEHLHPGPVAAAESTTELWGYGTALDDVTARIRAVCEGVERYCSVMYPTQTLEATARQLGDTGLDCHRLPRCSKREESLARGEHRLRTPDPDRPERWVLGYSLTRDAPVWVPLSVAYLGLPLPLTDHLVFPESTGFATGTSYRAAVSSALCEVIERDSVALWWLHQLPVPRIDPMTIDDHSLNELVARTRRVGIESTVLDLTTDVGVPVAGLIQTSRSGPPHALVAAACRTNMVAAIRRVFEEAGSLRIGLQPGAGSGADVRGGEPASPSDFGLLYAGRDGPGRFAFVSGGPPTSDATTEVGGTDQLATMVAGLAAMDAEVLAVDVTLPEVRAFGLVVVRVIVPELMRISFCHSIRYLGHPRLYEAPMRMSYSTGTEESITDDPHPFA